MVAVPQRFHSGSTAPSVEPLSRFGSKVLLLPSHSSAVWVAQFCRSSGNAVPDEWHSSPTAAAELCH
ncbi:MAG: hypothetical protein IJ901_01680 [Bacteroidaceae bacterium]|nr:hypothetical protein [Bacteroidaceae bacterium]